MPAQPFASFTRVTSAVKASGVAVIIAAFRASDTITPAIRSALSQPETAEVVVVDDCSGDATADAAHTAGGGDPRLKVLIQPQNGGPSRARNRGIAESTAPWIAVLDADDAFLPGRFAALLREPDWDFCADNIAFVQDLSDSAAKMPVREVGPSCVLDLTRFIEGNLPQRARVRGELGFLKPLYRRDFVAEHGLSYRENCRLGEDFLFYAEALAKGARFRVDRQCGYAALRRSDSLSSRHRTKDLRDLAAATRQFLDTCEIAEEERDALARHLRSTRARLAHREVLDLRHERGLPAALARMAAHPTVLGAILHDKFAPAQASANRAGKLVSDEAFAELCG